MSLNLKDTALASVFGANFDGVVERRSSGNRVVAIQYALGRLGYLEDLCDGSFGPITESALKAFQRSTSDLTETGIADVGTLAALDRALSAKDFRVPAVISGDPMRYLSDFRSLGLPIVRVEGSEE